MDLEENPIPRYAITIVENLEKSLKDACDQITDTELPTHESDRFDNNKFWMNFISAARLVSHEASKFCLAFEPGETISSEDCQKLMDGVEQGCLAFLAVFLTLPKSRGKILYRELQVYVLNILRGMKGLCAAIINESRHLQTVGDIWNQCEAVERLPRDNKDAVLQLCRQQHDMVHDASQELIQAEEDERNGALEISAPFPPNGIQMPPSQSWSPSDRNVIFPSVGMLKASKACIKKVGNAIFERADGNDERCIDELDLIADTVKYSSERADDFVMSIYPPMDHTAVRQEGNALRNNSKELLSLVRQCCFFTIEDEMWVEFLNKALDHNWARINDMVLTD